MNPVPTTPAASSRLMTPEDEKRILRERARLLARELHPEKDARNTIELVVF